MILLLVIILASLTVVSVSLQKTYHHIPLKELKRRAKGGDELAKGLHKAVSYGISLDVMLWGIIGLCASGFFVVLTSSLPSWLALFGCTSLLWVAFAWLPNSNITKWSEKLAQIVAPALAWMLERLYPVLNKIGAYIYRYGRITVHSGIYQKEDLVELLDKQAGQSDNRMTSYEIGIVKSSLTFSDKIIRDYMTPKRIVKTASSKDKVGPLLMDELHKTGFSRFPVINEQTNDIIGTLYMKDLVNSKHGGSVESVMKKKVYYVNEEKPLQHALQAFLRTKHHLFIVVNNFEEVVGIITIEDVLEQVLGKQIVDEFDRYEDLRAVAKLDAQKDHKVRAQAPADTDS
ncbi:CBS domain-containing protein [Candidatus Saccharibacteria bacterium]|nr:CBS domain-containing protein [Candidatus Saccharibacteria bacterium]